MSVRTLIQKENIFTTEMVLLANRVVVLSVTLTIAMSCKGTDIASKSAFLKRSILAGVHSFRVMYL